MDRITKYIYIGDYTCYKYIAENNIKKCVNCTKNIPTYTDGIRVPINDPGIDSDITSPDILFFLSHIREIVNYIDKQVNKGKKIVIYCNAGMQRSVTVLVFYFMFKKNLDFNSIVNFLIKRHRQTYFYGLQNNFKCICRAKIIENMKILLYT